MQRLALFFAALSLACSGSHDSAVRPEPTPSSAPPSSVAATPPPTTAGPAPEAPSAPPLAQTARPSEVRGRYVPRLDVEAVSIGVGESLRIHHPVAAVRARLDTLVDQQLRTLSAHMHDIAARRATAAAAQDEDVEVETEYLPVCTAPLATRNVVSVVCSGYAIREDRGDDSTMMAEGVTYAIDGDEIRVVTVEDALTAGADVTAERNAARDSATADRHSEYDGEGEWTLATQVLGADGIHYVWLSPWRSSSVDAPVAYASVLDRIRADGPIARLLRLGAYARGATPPVSTAPGEPSEGPWAIGAPIPVNESATRWLSLSEGQRAATSLFVDADARFAQLGITSDVGIETAREIATTLHSSLIAPAADTQLRRLAIMGATGSVNVRLTPGGSGRWLGTIPMGAFVVTVSDPSSATPASWISVIASSDLVGYAASRYLAPADCMPDATSVLAALPRDRREEAARGLVRIATTAIDHGHATPAALFVVPAGVDTTVSLRRLSGTCRTGAPIASWTTGPVIDVLVTRTAARGGETLVLVATVDREYEEGSDGRNEASWQALRVGASEPVWSSDALAHPSVANDVVAPARRGPSGRGFWPLAIVQRGQPIVPYRWDGTTLVQDTP